MSNIYKIGGSTKGKWLKCGKSRLALNRLQKMQNLETHLKPTEVDSLSNYCIYEHSDKVCFNTSNSGYYTFQ